MKARCPRCGVPAKARRAVCRCCGELVELLTCPYCGEFGRSLKKKISSPVLGNSGKEKW